MPGETFPGLEENMTIAESVVKEYLERGYSLESLRLLAESREQPLGGEMLAIIEALAASGGIPATTEDSGPCETAAYPVARGEEDAVFFIASDDEAVSEDGAVDFDVMADTVSREESVAEVVIAGPEGAGLMETMPPDTVDTGPDTAEQGIWSRLWSKVSGTADTPALAPSILGRTGGLSYEEDVVADAEIAGEGSDHSAPAMEASASEAFCETVAARMESVSDAIVEEVPEPRLPEQECSLDTDIDVGGGECSAVAMVTPEQASLSETMADGEVVAHPVDEHAISTPQTAVPVEQQPFADDLAAQAEISADYIPGSVSDLYDGLENPELVPLAESPAADSARASEMEEKAFGEAATESLSVIEAEKRRLDEAQAAIASAARETTSAFPAAELSTAACAEPAVSDSKSPAENRQESRRERRRRERSEKKKQKRAKKAPASAELPEIVLTRSEGTETMSVIDETAASEEPPEAPRAREPELASATESDLPAPVADASEVEESAGVREEDAAPQMSEPMSLLTPNDVIEDDSQIVEDSSAVSAAQASSDSAVEGLEVDGGTEESVRHLCLVDSGMDGSSETPDTDSDSDVVDSANDPVLFFSGNDHLMIIAGGGVTEEECAKLAIEDLSLESATEEDAAADAETEPSGNNVILFSEKFPVFAGICSGEEEFCGDESAEAEADSYHPVLHMLSSPEADVEDGESALRDEEEQGETALSTAAPLPLLESTVVFDLGELEYAGPGVNRLDDDARFALVRAMLGSGSVEDCLAEPTAEADIERGHVIVAQEPEPEPDDSFEREAAVREEMEREYQTRLDEFAARLLDMQSAVAAGESLVRDKKTELDAKGAIIAEMQKRLDEEVGSGRKMAANLIAAKAETKAREEELERFNGMQDEHQRLYKEFEDLRRAYNEVVADVMPGLQNERDDLALTVERQSGNEERLRSSLGSARKRLAVGYSLAGAACLALIALPVSNWLKSGQDDKQIAMEHQKVTELQDTLQREVQQNIDSQSTIVELRNKVEMARAQIADLQGKNKELARVSSRTTTPQSQGLAVFRPNEPASSGTPTRASDMALQATTQPGGRLHVNEIRDPAGSIEQLASMNRQQNSQQNTQLARAPQSTTRPIAMSSVARVEPRQGNGLRPTSAPPASSVAPAQRQSETAGAQRQRAGAATARPGEVLAKVKKGEGVAQVVYRELGTWDPEVVAWVIRENGITNDRRGNPRIHPDQVLRLPKGGRLNQAASAAPRR